MLCRGGVDVANSSADTLGGYLPASGTVETLDIPMSQGLRVDAGFTAGSTVSTFYDSMLAKVIAVGPTRDAARRTLAGGPGGGRRRSMTATFNKSGPVADAR